MALTDEQIASYRQNGYLLASGLIPDGVSARAEAAMWRLMRMDPGDPATWSRVPESAESRVLVGVTTMMTSHLLNRRHTGRFTPPKGGRRRSRIPGAR